MLLRQGRDLLLEAAIGPRRKCYGIFGSVDQLTVQSAIRVASEPSARWVDDALIDAELFKCTGIEDVLVSAPDQNSGMTASHRVQIVPKRQSLFRQLSLVPIAVAHDQLVAWDGGRPIADC